MRKKARKEKGRGTSFSFKFRLADVTLNSKSWKNIFEVSTMESLRRVHMSWQLFCLHSCTVVTRLWFAGDFALELAKMWFGQLG